MTIVGKIVGCYRIEAKLSEIVYRARDLNLSRKVVIKVLPALPAKATLNHANLITVFDIATADVEGQPVSFVAMEYFPGRSLDKLIGRKRIRVYDAVRYAIQIADGLAAAHAASIIHGRLQAGDILINEQGEVKILNVGLAGRTGAVDERSDIFSLGLMLQEIISDRHGEAPRELQRIIARCLRENPHERWQRMADIKIALEDLSEEWDSAKEAVGTHTERRTFFLFFGLPLAVAALGTGGYIGAHVLRPPQATFQRLTFQRGDVSGARFLPDGRTVLFSAQWATDPTRIFSMRPGRNEYSALNLPAGRILSISSLGEIAILIGSAGANGGPGTLARVPLSGDAPREVLENVNDADWSADGTELAVSHTVGGRNRIEYPIGTVLYETQGRPPLSLRVSPRGDQLAFFEYDNAVGDFAVTVLDRRGSKRVLSRGWTGEGGLAWSGSGEIWFSGTKTGSEPTLRAVNMNGDQRIVAAVPAWLVLKDITRNLDVLAAVVDSRIGISGAAGAGAEERDLSWFEASRIHDISIDGKTILFAELSDGRDRNTAIYLRKTDRSPAVRLGDGNRPALSPDGNWVACIVSDGPLTSLKLLPTGPGQTRTVGGTEMHYERVEWFPDSRRLLFQGNEPGRPVRTFVVDLNGGKALPLTPEGMRISSISPDQKYATAAIAGRLNLVPLDGGEPKAVANLEPGESVIRWSGNRRFIFLRRQTGAASLEIEKLDVTTSQKTAWRKLAVPDPVGVQIREVVMTPDGSAYAYSFQRDISTLYLAQGLR